MLPAPLFSTPAILEFSKPSAGRLLKNTAKQAVQNGQMQGTRNPEE
jgi:hypothetical protein